MLSDEVIEKVVDRLVRRIENQNLYIMEKIGNNVKKIGTLSKSEINKLVQIMAFGGDYQKIVNKIAETTRLNVKDIYKIFEEVAKNDYLFAKQFYTYKNVKYIPYEQNYQLKQQVDAIASMTARQYVNMTNSLAFSKKVRGRIVYTDIGRKYQEVIDKAITSVSEGKSVFYEEMYKVLKEMASSGIKTVNYQVKKSMRLDSAVRMNIQDGLKMLHNQIQKQIGKEFGADGIEITVHLNPAPDHELAQGKQFSINQYDKNGNLIKKGEWEKLQNGKKAKTYDGEVITLDHDHKNGFRPISTMNCYHYIFSIVLGVSEPSYSKEELKEIIEKNDKGFEFEGKHYTNYEGTQLQRKLETEIRKNKEAQMLGISSNDENLIRESQNNITLLTRKYNELSKASELPTRLERARVSGYKRVKVSKK